MTLKTFIYPSKGSNKPKNLSDVKNIAAELNTAIVAYCKDEGVLDLQGIKLPGLPEALTTISDYQKEIKGTSNELSVRAGIDDKGNLAMTVSGILPRKGKPAKIDDTVVIRKDFASVVTESQNQANSVVNLQTGDKVIDKAAKAQAKKFGTTVEEPDDAEFGDLTTGYVILAAHGSRLEVNGTIIGTKLGKRTPQQIVDLLTSGDKKKRLSKDFSGTVWLSGCFTAAGGIAPPGSDYDYESFARSVWELLKKQGYKNASVKGQPGTAYTDSEGEKSSTTPTGQKDNDKIKKQLAQIQTQLEKTETALEKLKKDFPDDGERRANPAYVKQFILLNELKKITETLKAEKQTNIIKGLVATYGVSAR